MELRALESAVGTELDVPSSDVRAVSDGMVAIISIMLNTPALIASTDAMLHDMQSTDFTSNVVSGMSDALGAIAFTLEVSETPVVRLVVFPPPSLPSPAPAVPPEPSAQFDGQTESLSREDLGSGATAGIVIGGVLGVLVVVALCCLLYKQRSRKAMAQAEVFQPITVQQVSHTSNGTETGEIESLYAESPYAAQRQWLDQQM